MSVNLSPFAGAGAQFFTDAGTPLTGGLLYSYAAGTTTPATTYTSSDGATANSNPIVLDAAGRVPYEIWLTSGSSYKFVLKTSVGTTVGTWDNIDGINDVVVGTDFYADVFTTTAGQTTFTLSANPGSINNLTVSLDGAVLTAGADFTWTGTTLVLTMAAFADQTLRVAYSSVAGVKAISPGSVIDNSVAVGTKLYNLNTALNTVAATFTDGTNTITGGYRVFSGNNTASTDDSAFLVGRGLSGSYSSGAHAFRDESTYTSPSGTGLFGYSSFDSIATIGGSVTWNHAHSYQARLQYTGSGLNDEIYGYGMQLTHNGSGTVTNVYGLRMSDSLGVGPITNQVALWVDPLTRGAANYALYSISTSVSSYHGGLFQFGSMPKIAGLTTYGAIFSHDGSGNFLDNPNLTIVNGVLTLANATTSKIVSATAQNLQLDAPVIVQSNKPVQLPVYTVATLPSPASAYTYCKAFVSDATATTFASIVAGGGANKVPVYCDGTNWRIG